MTRRAEPLPGDGDYRPPLYGRVIGAALIATALAGVVLLWSVWGK